MPRREYPAVRSVQMLPLFDKGWLAEVEKVMRVSWSPQMCRCGCGGLLLGRDRPLTMPAPQLPPNAALQGAPGSTFAIG